MTEANTSHKLCVRTKKTLGALRTAVQPRSAHEGVPTAAQELLPLLQPGTSCTVQKSPSRTTQRLCPPCTAARWFLASTWSWRRHQILQRVEPSALGKTISPTSGLFSQRCERSQSDAAFGSKGRPHAPQPEQEDAAWPARGEVTGCPPRIACVW